MTKRVRRRPRRKETSVLGSVVVLVVIALVLLSLGSTARTDGEALSPPGTTALRATTSRVGDRARLSVTGRIRPGGSDASVLVRVLGQQDTAAPCRVPEVTAAGKVVVPAGGIRVGWVRASGPRPGDALTRGRRFAMVGTVKVPDTGALRLCVHLVRAGRRPMVLRTLRVVVPNRTGLTPPAVVLRPVWDGAVVPALKGVAALLVLVVLVVLLVPTVVLVRRALRRRRARSSRRPDDLPPLPFGVRVPDAPPRSPGPGLGPSVDHGPGPAPTADDDAATSTSTSTSAGSSAQATGVRREAGWRERRRREVEAAGGVFDPGELPPMHVRAWSIGADGERLAADRFSALAPGYPGVHVLHDRRHPHRRRANIDHVLVGPAGVVVADTKHWAGRLRISDGRLIVRGRDRTKAIEGVLAQVSAVRSILAQTGFGAVPVLGVLHWTRGEDVRLDGSLELSGVPLLDARGTMLRAVDGGVLGRDGVARVLAVLEDGLPPAS